MRTRSLIGLIIGLLGVIAVVATLLLALLIPVSAGAQTRPGQRCFTETGYCIAGPIRDYWERNGGLPVFGYPIAAEREELTEGRSIRVQWFERDRIEIQADGTMTAGRLGARYLELTGRPWFFNENGAPPSRPTSPCRFFPQTGYSICNAAFRAYWENNGGLERFGYPITDVLQETLEGRTYQVQYFERRRMEYHPQFAGTQYEVQLGLLGRDIATAAICPAAPTSELQRAVRAYLAVMGCPSDQGRANRALAWQRYERGVMYWIDASSSAPPMIFIIVNNNQAQRSTWLATTDTYREGEPVGGQPPAGRIAPVRGFGKVWWNSVDIQAAVGWPIEAEQSATGAALAFNTGGWMVHHYAQDQIIVMQPDGTAFGVRGNILPR